MGNQNRKATKSEMVDEIVEEVHAARRKIWEECGCDFHKLVERLMRLQEQHPERLVHKVPKTESEPTPAE
jgi:hypothetical protein